MNTNTQTLRDPQFSNACFLTTEKSTSSSYRKKRADEYVSSFLRFHWQMPLGVDHAYVNQKETDMTDIHQYSINLGEEYEWLTCYIWLTERRNIVDIDRETILLNSKISISSSQVKHEGRFLIIKLPWLQVKELLKPGEVRFTISAKLYDGTTFESSDTVTVIDERKER